MIRLISIGALLLGAAPAAAAPKPAAPNPEAAIIADAKRAVADHTRDPNAVQFRDLTVRTAPIGKVVCGQMNAKNAYGGYVGFTNFIYSGGAVYLDDQRDVGYMLMRDKCR